MHTDHIDPTDNLVTMANQIGSFFSTMPDRKQALTDLAGHLRRYWEPRMRHALLERIDEQGDDSEVMPFVIEAIATHRATMM